MIEWQKLREQIKEQDKKEVIQNPEVKGEEELNRLGKSSFLEKDGFFGV